MNLYLLFNKSEPLYVTHIAVAESEIQVHELAFDNDIDMENVGIDLERENIRPQYGKLTPHIKSAIVC